MSKKKLKDVIIAKARLMFTWADKKPLACVTAYPA